MPETVHHSLDLDGGGVDRISARVRLVSNESKSPMAFRGGNVRLCKPSGNPEGTEDDGWGGLSASFASSTNTIDDVGEEGPRVRTSLRCLPIEVPLTTILF
jgi:hypothetical protein